MQKDTAIFDLIAAEHRRQVDGIELIASENYVSDEVMRAMGSCLTNKYAEGYPGKRYYGGCQVVDQVEELARERVARRPTWQSSWHACSRAINLSASTSATAATSATVAL